MEGVLLQMVTTTTVPALMQSQGDMDNSLSTLSGLMKKIRLDSWMQFPLSDHFKLQ